MSSSKTRSKQTYNLHPAFSSIDDLRTQLKTNTENGLSSVAVQDAQRSYGPNKLEGEGTVKWYSVLFKQISNAMILVGLS